MSDEIKMTCPSCKKELHFPLRLYRREIACPHCKDLVIVDFTDKKNDGGTSKYGPIETLFKRPR